MIPGLVMMRQKCSAELALPTYMRSCLYRVL